MARLLTALQRTDELARLALAGNAGEAKAPEQSELVAALVNYLVAHPMLRALDLSHNAALGGAHIGTLLDQLRAVRLQELSVAGIPLSDDDVSRCGVALRLNASLVRLDLSQCALSLAAFQVRRRPGAGARRRVASRSGGVAELARRAAAQHATAASRVRQRNVRFVARAAALGATSPTNSPPQPLRRSTRCVDACRKLSTAVGGWRSRSAP